MVGILFILYNYNIPNIHKLIVGSLIRFDLEWTGTLMLVNEGGIR